MFKSCALAVEATSKKVWRSSDLSPTLNPAFSRLWKSLVFKQVYTSFLHSKSGTTICSFTSITTGLSTKYTGLITIKSIQLNKGLVI